MRWAIGLIVAAGLASIATACVLLDGPGAALVAFATVVVMLLGAAPVVFSAVMRRRDQPRGGPTVVRRSDMTPGAPASGPSPRRGQRREHRRPRA